MNKLTEVNGNIVAGTDCIGLLKKHYGLDIVSLKRENGFKDITFTAKASDQTKYTFKVLIDFAVGTLDEKLIMGELSLIRFLSEHGIPVPKPILTLKGEDFGEDEFEDSTRGKHMKRFRLQSYIEGRVIDIRDEQDSVLYTPSICQQIGHISGRMNKALVDFPAFMPCDAEYILRIPPDHNMMDFVEHLPTLSEKQRQLTAKWYEQMYKPMIFDNLEKFPKHMIHGDLHGSNFVLDGATATKVVGLIDFGQARMTLRLLDPAFVIGLIMLFATEPIECCKAFLDAYQEHYPLLELEKRALRTAVAGNFLHYYIFHHVCLTSIPGYDPSLIEHALKDRGWVVVEKLLDPESEESKFLTLEH